MSTTTSTRLKSTGFTSRVEFDAAVDRIAEASAQLRKLEAVRDTAIQAVRDTHNPAIDAIDQERKALVALAEKYAETHRPELFVDGKKSADTALAFFGFRIGNPTLKVLNRKWNWESVLDAVKSRYKARFVRTEESPDKDALKAQLSDEQLAEVGLRIEQSETFFVEPKDVATKA